MKHEYRNDSSSTLLILRTHARTHAHTHARTHARTKRKKDPSTFL